jgi:hypothetical protein
VKQSVAVDQPFYPLDGSQTERDELFFETSSFGGVFN